MDKHFSNAQRAEVLTQALPYIKRYNGKIVVIKYGGNAMINAQLKEQVMEDIVLLHLTGVKVVLVHGGGPEISELMTKLGKKVRFLVATNGCVGSLDESLTSDQIVQTRRQEALTSAHLLGVDDVVFLSHNDGNDYDLEAMKRDFVACILDFQPQVVFCPDYTVPSECHPDHVNVGKVATESVFVATWQKLTSRLGLQGSCPASVLAYYYTHKPNCYVGVGKTYKLQRQAMACHVSQFDQATLNSFNTYFSAREICFGMRCFKRRAEGFRVLAPVHQHCFPEASNW